jgi:hypothetical protein
MRMLAGHDPVIRDRERQSPVTFMVFAFAEFCALQHRFSGEMLR